MCGIAGVLVSRKSESLDFSEALTRLSSALATRGPDASGQWVSSTRILGFAHRRLAVLPPRSAGTDSTLLFSSRRAQMFRQKCRPIPLSLVEAFSMEVPFDTVGGNR